MGRKPFAIGRTKIKKGRVNENEELNGESYQELNDNTTENVNNHNAKSHVKYKKISESRKKCGPQTELDSFLNSLPKMESHYCRASTNKLYLEPNWISKQAVYEEYCRWSAEKNVKPLSIATFSVTFSKKNLSLFRPKKDDCEVCVGYRTKNLSEDYYNVHIEKKNEARLEKTNDKENENNVFTMDLQSVLLCPKSNVSSLYYKAKLTVHNFTFFNLKTKEVICYLWHESEGGLTANEFASCICDVVTNVCSTPNSKISLYSNGCCYQNRNAILGNALFNLAKLKNITIVQKYLEKGHTQMEADSVHAQIEKQVRKRIFNCPADYVSAIENARKNPSSYSVKYLDHTFFHKYEDLNYFKSIRPGKKAGDPCVVDLRALQYTPLEVSYKLRFKDEWRTLSERGLLQNQALELSDIPPLLTERVPIKKSKYDDLQSLKATLPSDYHSFYDNLPWK